MCLAHILNAEGEKLQKAVEIADNICELLEINQSVNKTITKITFLEQVLYAKLELSVTVRPVISVRGRRSNRKSSEDGGSSSPGTF